jgi:hypothetical protein
MSLMHNNDIKIHLSKVSRMYLGQNGKIKVKVNSKITTSCGKVLNSEASTVVRFSQTPIEQRCLKCDAKLKELLKEYKKIKIS